MDVAAGAGMGCCYGGVHCTTASGAGWLCKALSLITSHLSLQERHTMEETTSSKAARTKQAGMLKSSSCTVHVGV